MIHHHVNAENSGVIPAEAALATKVCSTDSLIPAVYKKRVLGFEASQCHPALCLSPAATVVYRAWTFRSCYSTFAFFDESSSDSPTSHARSDDFRQHMFRGSNNISLTPGLPRRTRVPLQTCARMAQDWHSGKIEYLALELKQHVDHAG